jgi:hypothetical protein
MRFTAGIRHLVGSFLFFRKGRESSSPASVTERKVREDPSASSPVTERRQAPRRYGDPVQVVLFSGLAGARPFGAWVMNRSTGGLGLSVPQPMEPGLFLHVRVTRAPDDVPWVTVEVKSCRPLAGRWILGCQYVEAPSKEVLLLFR